MKTMKTASELKKLKRIQCIHDRCTPNAANTLFGVTPVDIQLEINMLK